MFQPRAEARGELCSVHIVLSCYINLYFSFAHLVWPLTPPPPYSPPPPSPCQPPSPPPLPAPSPSPTLCIGIYRTDPTTIMTPVLPDVVLPPYIDPVSDKSRYTGGCCSGSGVHMNPPALSVLLPLLRQYLCIPTTPLCSALAALPLDDGPSCGGIHRGSYLS